MSMKVFAKNQSKMLTSLDVSQCMLQVLEVKGLKMTCECFGRILKIRPDERCPNQLAYRLSILSMILW